MPTYQYACTECHDQFEIVQKFTDDALTECPHCGGKLRKVFSAVGVVFKGSGFYRTDSRSSSSSSTPASSSSKDGSSGSSSSGSGDSGSSGSGSGSSDSSGATSKPIQAPKPSSGSSSPAS